MMHPEDRRTFDKTIKRHLVYPAPFEMELQFRTPEWEHWRIMQIRGKVQRDDTGKALRMAGTIADITERKEAEKKLHFNAYHDSLTEIPNRLSFLEDLNRGLKVLKMDDPDSILAVLLVDIRQFKYINESFGHSSGDEVLINFTHRVQRTLSYSEKLYRIGSDQFAIIQDKVLRKGDIDRLAESVFETLENPLKIESENITLKASMGIAFGDTFSESANTLFQNALVALYKAKQKGVNVIELYTDELIQKKRNQFQVEQDLRKALLENELFAVYQPIFDIKKNVIVGFEALVRWRHPQMGLISPDDFISVAEESGLILELGEWMLRTASAQFNEWLIKYPTLDFISVNVSSPQMSLQDLPKMVARVIESTGLPPQRLKLEITESVTMQDMTHNTRVIKELSETGIRVSIDDFGTGYSSLAYLHSFAVSTLKIDRSFILDLFSTENGSSIVKAILAMAKSMNLTTIAEGVENEREAEFLLENGCDMIQGFLYGRPLVVEDASLVLIEQFPKE
jgi:diguanylate cyclase (GGDEF)-like protein